MVDKTAGTLAWIEAVESNFTATHLQLTKSQECPYEAGNNISYIKYLPLNMCLYYDE